MRRTVLAAFAWSLVAAPASADAETDFAVRVWPMLKARCLPCHGDDAKKLRGGLDLSTAASAKRVLDPGGPLLRSISRTDDKFAAMPPKEADKLTESEVAVVKAWVAAGAPWPSAARVAEIVARAKPVGVRVKTSGGLSPEWTNRDYKRDDVWAYRAPVAGSPSVDRHVHAKLRELDLRPAARADRRTLLRRVTFGLTGLPPTTAEAEAFLSDPAADDIAFARVVDRLLASPHYGERMAQHWLDVTRYADSAGLANDYERGSAWRYRDYVARSFNADKPYDQFVKEQVAGDEIAPDDPEMLVAVGFLRMGAWELTGMEVAKVARQRFLDDVTDAVGQAFLGQVMQCCRCHDHKVDPIPTRDYYRLQAAFATTQPAERAAVFLSSENRSGFGERKHLLMRQERLTSELGRLQKKEAEGKKKWAEANPDKKGQKPERHEYLTPAELGLERVVRKGLERLRWELDRYEPVALSVYSGRTPTLKAIYSPFRVPNLKGGELERTHILAGGDAFSPTLAVSPGVLSAAGDRDLPTAIVGRRAALAEWLTDAKNPLTARVMVNRVWQGHFGSGLAGNPNNFGAAGKRPTHPELLDALAVDFVAGGWSIKRLHRRILLSDAYARSSRHDDPRATAWYAAFPPRRLTAEEIRDAALFVSGELNREVGGVPSRPELPADVAFEPRQVMGTFAAAWEPSPLPSQRHRRSLYMRRLRGLRDPFLEVFGQPSAEGPCEGRESPSGAPQALALFNGESARLRALAWARRLLVEANTDDEAVTRAFAQAFQRSPSEKERAACLRHWAAMTERHRGLKFTRPKVVRELMREAVEENTGEKFTFREVLESAGDFVPDAHPADADARTRGLMEVCLVLLNTSEFLYLD